MLNSDTVVTNSSLSDETPSFVLEDFQIGSEEDIRLLWLEITKSRVLLDDEEKDSIDVLVSWLNNRRNVIFSVKDEKGELAGILFFLFVVPHKDALFRPMFFDRALQGKEKVAMEALQKVFAFAMLPRISARVPNDRKAELKFLGRLGFRHEGRIRRSTRRNTNLVDTHVFGMLPEEIGN